MQWGYQDIDAQITTRPLEKGESLCFFKENEAPTVTRCQKQQVQRKGRAAGFLALEERCLQDLRDKNTKAKRSSDAVVLTGYTIQTDGPDELPAQATW